MVCHNDTGHRGTSYANRGSVPQNYKRRYTKATDINQAQEMNDQMYCQYL